MRQAAVVISCDRCGIVVEEEWAVRVAMPSILTSYSDHEEFPLIADLCPQCQTAVVTEAFKGWIRRPSE